MAKKLSPAISRKKETGKTDPGKIKKTVIICCVAAVLLLVAVWAVTGAVSAYGLLNPPRRELAYTDGPAELDMVYEFFELTDFNGSDDIVGWWIPSQDSYGEYVESDKTVIMSHNYQSNREMTEMDGLYLIADLVHSGYNVITFDYTGSGNSRGSNYTFGAQETDELSLVIDYAAKVRGQEKIALMGFAFGSGPAIVAGCSDDRVSAVIADSPYLDLRSYLDKNISTWSMLPDLIFSPYINTMLSVFSGSDMECSPLTAVAGAQGKSFLFMHGEEDSLFPYQNSVTLADTALNAGNDAQYKVFTGVPHELGYIYAEDEYLMTLLTFLSETFESTTHPLK